jgi:hypothetical protein
MPAQIVIVPSAEQSSGTLTLKGQERAEALAPYLSQTSTYITPGVFQTLFATRPNLANPSLASTQTLAPLGFSLSLPVHAPYGAGQELAFASQLLSDQRYSGSNIMIAWEIEYVPALIEALGFTPPIDPIPSDRSDLVFVLSYPKQTVSPDAFTQQLLYGDSSTLPP